MTDTRLVGFNAGVGSTLASALQGNDSAGQDAGDAFAALLSLLGGAAAVSPEGPQGDAAPDAASATDTAAAPLFPLATALLAKVPLPAQGPATKTPDVPADTEDEAPTPETLATLGDWLRSLLKTTTAPTPEAPDAPVTSPDPAASELPETPLPDLAAALLNWFARPVKPQTATAPASNEPAKADLLAPAPESDDDAPDAPDPAAAALPGPALALALPAPLAPAAPEAPPPLNDKAAKTLEAVGRELAELAPKLAEADPALGKALTRLAEKLEDPKAAASVLRDLGFPATDSGDLPAPVAQFAEALGDTKSDPLPQLQRLLATANTAPDAAPQTGPDLRTRPVSRVAGNEAAPKAEAAKPVDRAPKTADTQREPEPAAPDATKPERLTPATQHHEATGPAPSAAAAAAGPAAVADTKPQPPAGLRPVQAAYQQPPAPPAPVQVAFELAHHASAGHTKFEMRLDPPELGRVDVSLTLDKAGNTHAHLIVEKPETLDLMQRDQRGLQQALQQAGLDTSRTTMEFQLRQQNPFAGDFSGLQQDRRQQGQQNPGTAPRRNGPGNDDTSEIEATGPVLSRRGTMRLGGINLMV